MYTVLGTVLIFRHTNKHSFNVILALLVIDKAINLDDKDVKSILENNVLCGVSSILDYNKHLQGSRVSDGSFG